MAEGVVFTIAKRVLDLLSLLAREKIGELWGIKDELVKLQITVSTIRAVLLHAEEQYHQSLQVKEWVLQLKDALCDAEDLLGYFYVESRLKDLRSQNKIMKEVSTFFSSSNQLVQRFKMANKLKEVRRKIDVIKHARSFHLDERRMDREERAAIRRQENVHSFRPEKEIIGRDADKREIVKLLLQDSDGEENIPVVSIVGIGGLGKTTLAQSVFNEEDVKKHFELRMWVTVSDDFNIKNIVEKIIASAKDASPEHFEMDQMQRRLRKEIDGKRYLLVLDDLWNDGREEWLNLKILLDGGARGSKILITTRSSIVAQISDSVDRYDLKGLSTRASLDLFMHCASSREQEITKSVKDSVGETAVEKCSGVPLAIRVIGGMLFLKKTEAEWLSFKEVELPKIPRKENDITAVLKISYDHLPSYLKQCFAFCSLFPKDYQMEKSTLTSLWIAQGFIQPSIGEDLDLEQKAHDSFMHLLDRGFFQDREDDDLGNVGTCKMHDLMNDLACQVAGTGCNVIGPNLMNDLTCQVAGTGCNVIGPNRRGPLCSNNLRHLSYPSNNTLFHEFPKLQFENMKVRTLLSTDQSASRTSGIIIRSLLAIRRTELTCHKLMSSLKHLRSLTLQNTDMIVVPNSLCKLKLLSYLDLSYNRLLEQLPNSIKSLQNMTTLILIGCSHLKELPSDIVDLVSLTNLSLEPDCDMESMPRGLKKVTSLQRLTYFVVREDSCKTKNCAKLKELGDLNSLRTELTIKMVGHIKNAAVESKSANLEGKQFLDTLHLDWSTQEHGQQDVAKLITNHEALLEGLQPHSNLRGLSIRGYKGTTFPRWMMEDIAPCLPHLVEVNISDCEKCRYLPTLGLLPHLKTLTLSYLDEAESVGIPIHDTSSSNLYTSSPSFPSLLKLDITKCPKLKTIPPIENVKEVYLTGVSAEFVEQSFHLHRLEDLRIEYIECLESLRDWLQHCTTLKKLRIERCENLTSLLESMTQLKSLEQLTIVGCPKLMALPDRMGDDLASLKKLRIYSCDNLISLPESMTHLKSLQLLDIWRCEQLKEKCKRDIGKEWYKIKHIPTVLLDNQTV